MPENKYIQLSENPPEQRGIFYLKRFLLLLSFAIVPKLFFAQAAITFAESKKKFEDVKKGTLVKLEYDFTNTGNQPLLITNYEVECSCTSAEFPKQPIPPGQSGKIIVTFDTKSVYERQDRIVEIFSNAKNSPAKIRFKGYVERVK